MLIVKDYLESILSKKALEKLLSNLSKYSPTLDISSKYKSKEYTLEKEKILVSIDNNR